MTPGRAHESHLAKAEELITTAGTLLREQRPMTVAAALLSESAPFPVWALDRQHALLWCNRAFEIRFGVRAHEARGRTLPELWGLRNADVARDDELTMATGGTHAYVAEVDDRTVQVTKWPLLAEDGSVIGLCGVLR